MKNLKKILALVMVFAMMATAMFSAAAFTDSADIEATDAVELLSTLGVINGYEDGSFKPNGTVTRAEMAAMLYIIRNGGKSSADGYKSAPTSFTDISGHWAEGYIKHAQTMGLISGRSDTVFDPDAQVTGVEAALMCLRAAGYKTDKAGIGGATWQTTTMALANEVGMIDDVNANLFAALPRQWAAQMMSNLLDADYVVWSKDTESFKAYKDDTDATVGKKFMDIAHDDNDDVILNKVELKDDGTYTLSLSGTGAAHHASYTKVTKDYSDLIGAPVDVMYKTGHEDKVFGVKAQKDVVFYDVIAKDIEFDTDKITVDGKDLEFESSVDLVSTNGAATVGGTGVIASFANETALKDELYANDARNYFNLSTELTLIDTNNDKEIDKIVYTPAFVEKINYVGSNAINTGSVDKAGDEKMALAPESDMKKAKYEIYEGAKKDDFVLVYPNANIAEDATIIEKVDVVSGKVEAQKQSHGNDQYKIGDTWYTEYNQYLLCVGTPGNDETEINVGDTVEFVVVNDIIFNGKVTASDVSMDNIIYVTKSANGSGLNTSDVLFEYVDTKGETKTGKATKVNTHTAKADDNGGSPADGDLLEGRMYTYTMDGNDFELKEVKSGNLGSYKGILVQNTDFQHLNKALRATDKDSAKVAYIADDAVVFVHTTDKTKVLSGAAVNALADHVIAKDIDAGGNDINGLSSALYDEVNGIKYVKVANLAFAATWDEISGSADLLYGYITSDVVSVKVDDDPAYQFTMWTGSEEKTVSVKEAKKGNATPAKGDFVSYKATATENVVELVEEQKDAAYADDELRIAQIQGYTDTELVLNVNSAGSTKGTFKITKDTKFIYVDSANVKGLPDGSIGLPQTNAGATTKKYANVVFQANSDDELQVVFVEVSGKLKIGDSELNWKPLDNAIAP